MKALHVFSHSVSKSSFVASIAIIAKQPRASYRGVQSVLCAIVAIAFFGQSVQAQSTWNGSTSTDWALTGNWSPGTPTFAQYAEFNSTFTNQPFIGENDTVGAIWDTGSLGQNVTITGTNSNYTLTITGSLTAATGPNGMASTAILLNDAGNNNLTLNVDNLIVQGSPSFVVDNDGTLTISQQFQSNALTLGNGSANTTPNATDSFGGTINLAGGVTGTGGITINTLGTIDLGGGIANTGDDQFTEGVVNLTGALSGATRVYVTGGILTISGSGSVSTTGANGLFVKSGGNLVETATATDGITGGTIFSVEVAATAILPVVNDYTGGTTLGYGTSVLGDGSSIVIGNAGSLGTGTLATGGGVLSSSSTSALTIANAFTLGTNGGLILGGSNPLIFTGSGAAATSGYATIIDNDSAPVTFSGGTYLTAANGGGRLVFEGTGNVAFGDAILVNASGTNGILMGGTGTVTLTGANTYVGSTEIASGTLKLDYSAPGAPTSNIINSSSSLQGYGGTLLINGQGSTDSNTQTFASTVAEKGASTITLNQNGDTTLTVALGTISRTASSGATLNFSNAPSTSGIIATAVGTGSLTDSSGIIAPYVTVGTGASLQYAALNGSNQVVAYTGATAATANLANMTSATTNYTTSSGATTTASIAGDTLNYTGSGSTITLGSATTLTLNGLMNSGTGALTIASPGTLDIGANTGFTTGYYQLDVVSNNQNITIGSVIANNGSNASTLVYSGIGSSPGTLALSGANTFTGGTILNSGILEIENTAALGNSVGTFTINGGTVEANGAYTVANPVTIGNNFTFAGAGGHALNFSGLVSLNADASSIVTLTLGGTSSDTLEFSNVISGAAGSGLIVNGTSSSAVLELTGLNTTLGPISLNGGTVELANTAAATAGTNGPLGASGLIFFNGGTLEIGSTNAAALDYSSRFAGLAGQNFNINIAGTLSETFASAIDSYGGNLNKSGTGTLTLSGINEFSGNTTVTAGTLDLKNAQALQYSTLTTAGITFDSAVTSDSFEFGGLSGSGNIALQNTASTAVALSVGTNNSNTSYSGALSAGGSLTKVGTGTLNLTGTNSYTGGTFITAGTLAIGGSGTLGSGSYAANILDNATFNYNSSAAQTLSGKISGSGVLTQSGSGTLTLSNANTYTGATTVSAGELNITGSTASTGVVNVSNGAKLTGNGGSTGIVTVAGGGSIALQDGTVGTLTVGGLTIGGSTHSSMTFDIGSTLGSSDSIADNGALTLLTAGGTTITIGNASGVSSLANGNYSLITYSGAYSGSLADLTLSTTSLDGKTLSLTQGSGVIYLTVAGGSASGTTYTLSTTAGSTLLHSGATTTLTTTVTNTGTGTADTLNYSGLGATAANGSVSGSTTSGGALANNGGSAINTQTYTATTAGSGTITPTGLGTNATVGGNATLSSSTGTTINVYTGVGVWNTNGGGTWGTVSATPANWTANGGTPGITAGFANTDSASFGAILASGTGSVTLDGENPSLNAIAFNDSAASYVIAQGSGTGSITLDGNGGNANVTDLAGSHTISAPIDLATSANVNVASGQQLTMSGTVSGPGGLVNDGAGTTILSGSNGYSGGTTVSSGTLQLSNSGGSATGSGALNVGAGAVLAGAGSSSGTGFSITGSGGTAATVLVGHNNASDINTTGVMSLQGSGASSIGSAKLVFNLNSNVAGQGNELNVGATAITFNTVGGLNTTMSLNIEGTSFIAGYTAYVLVAGTGTTNMGVTSTPTLTSGQYGGLETFVNSRGQDQIVTGPTSNLQLTFADSTQASFYGAHSYLFLVNNAGVDDIEVEVVPEPGTWVMMLGGLAMLVVWQRRKNIS